MAADRRQGPGADRPRPRACAPSSASTRRRRATPTAAAPTSPSGSPTPTRVHAALTRRGVITDVRRPDIIRLGCAALDDPLRRRLGRRRTPSPTSPAPAAIWPRVGARRATRMAPMSVVKINAIAVPPGAGPELEARFAARGPQRRADARLRGLPAAAPGRGRGALLRLHPLGQRGVVPGVGQQPGVPARPRQGRVVRRQAGVDRRPPARLRGRPARHQGRRDRRRRSADGQPTAGIGREATGRLAAPWP